MEKAFALIVLMVTPTMAFAQGTVAFENNSAGLVTEYPTPPPGPASIFSVELIAAPHGTSLPNPLGTYVPQDLLQYFIPNYSSLAGFLVANPGWVVVATTGSAVAGGLFNGGVVTINNIAAGAHADYIFIGWSGAFGNLDTAIASGNAKVGESVIATTATGDPTATPQGVPVSLSGTFAGLTLAPIPEPSTFTLAGLGLAALLVLRRRR